jgi:L-alanine-DL-glutamate epimerase-like enolase superfamily enzyme
VPFVSCPFCKTKINVSSKFVGRKGRCTSCKGVFRVLDEAGNAEPVREESSEPASAGVSAAPPAPTPNPVTALPSAPPRAASTTDDNPFAGFSGFGEPAPAAFDFGGVAPAGFAPPADESGGFDFAANAPSGGFDFAAGGASAGLDFTPSASPAPAPAPPPPMARSSPKPPPTKPAAKPAPKPAPADNPFADPSFGFVEDSAAAPADLGVLAAPPFPAEPFPGFAAESPTGGFGVQPATANAAAEHTADSPFPFGHPVAEPSILASELDAGVDIHLDPMASEAPFHFGGAVPFAQAPAESFPVAHGFDSAGLAGMTVSNAGVSTPFGEPDGGVNLMSPSGGFPDPLAELANLGGALSPQPSERISAGPVVIAAPAPAEPVVARPTITAPQLKLQTVEVFLAPSAIPTKDNSADTVLIRLTANSGMVGWGELPVDGQGLDRSPRLAARSFARRFGAALKGLPIWNDATVQQALRRLAPPERDPQAWFAFDMALADLRAKSVGLPVSALLGTRPAASIGYATPLEFESSERLLSGFADGLRRGETAFVIRLGLHDERLELEAVQDAMRTVGRGAAIWVDGRQSLRLDRAESLARELGGSGVRGLLDPVLPGGARGPLERLGALGVSLAASASVRQPADLFRWIEGGLISQAFLRPDLLGGRGTVRAAAVAHAAGLPVGGMLPASSPLAIAYGVALMASVSAELPLVIQERPDIDRTLFRVGYTLTRGRIKLADEPGLGIEPDGETLGRFRTGA